MSKSSVQGSQLVPIEVIILLMVDHGAVHAAEQPCLFRCRKCNSSAHQLEDLRVGHPSLDLVAGLLL